MTVVLDLLLTFLFFPKCQTLITAVQALVLSFSPLYWRSVELSFNLELDAEETVNVWGISEQILYAAKIKTNQFIKKIS